MDKNLIYNLLDGSLTEIEKIEAFKLLSENKDLREEFTYASKLNNSLRENKDNFIIPVGSKEAIFSDIGLSLSNSTTSSSIFASKAFVSIVSSIVTFVLMSSIYLYSINKNEVIINEDDNTYEILKTHINLPNIKNEYVNLAINKSQETTIIKNIISNDKILEDGQNILNVDKVEGNISNEITLNYSELASLIDSKTEINKDNTNLIKINQNYENQILTKFYIELTNSVNQNLPQETISPSNIQKFNNSNLTIFYEVNDLVDVGIDIRRENFFQRYEDKVYKYEQTPNFTSYSLSARYNFLNNILIDDLKAYSQLGVGFNEGGFVSRASLGLYYELSKGFGINSNFEYSNLFFKNNFNTFNSHKISINYGIRYKF